MRIVVRGDLHLDLVSDGLRRLDEQARVVDFTLDVLEDLKPDVFVDLGDLFDRTRPSPDAYALAARYVLRLGELLGHRAYVLAGNHDKPTRGHANALAPLEELEGVGVQVVVGPYLDVYPSQGTTLAFLPYVTDWEARQEAFGSAQELLDGFVAGLLESEARRILAFTHLEVPGARLADDDRVQRDVGTAIPGALLEDERVVRVYAGHVHKYQELKRVTVVGSALHVDFGEAADPKGLIVAEV